MDNKPCRGNRCYPFTFNDFPQLQPKPRDRRAPPLVVVHALSVRQKLPQTTPVRLAPEKSSPAMTFSEYVSTRLTGIFEVLWFCLPMIAFGFLVGSITGFRSARRGLGLESWILKTLLIAVTPPLAFFFVVGIYGWRGLWPTPTELTFLAGMKSGLVHMAFFGTGFAGIGAIASLLSYGLSYSITKRCNATNNQKKKPNNA